MDHDPACLRQITDQDTDRAERQTRGRANFGDALGGGARTVDRVLLGTQSASAVCVIDSANQAFRTEMQLGASAAPGHSERANPPGAPSARELRGRRGMFGRRSPQHHDLTTLRGAKSKFSPTRLANSAISCATVLSCAPGLVTTAIAASLAIAVITTPPLANRRKLCW